MIKREAFGLFLLLTLLLSFSLTAQEESNEEFLINTFIGSLLIFVGVFFANRAQKDKKAAT